MSDDEVFELDSLEEINIAGLSPPTTKSAYLYSSNVKSYFKQQPSAQLNEITPIQLRKISTPLTRIHFEQKQYVTVLTTSHKHCHKDRVVKHSSYLPVYLSTNHTHTFPSFLNQITSQVNKFSSITTSTSTTTLNSESKNSNTNSWRHPYNQPDS